MKLLMKKSMLMMMVLISTLQAWAYDYPYLTFQLSDGSTQSVAVESLVLTFNEAGQLVATNADGMQTFTLTNLSKMYFGTESTGIAETISSTPVDGTVEVFTTGGVFIGRFNTMSQARAQMKQGVYVVKQNGQTKKIAVK